jgi:prepilin-type N-terminal cleavage/methylation domain-containing protein
MTPSLRDQEGFSLVEVLVSTALFVIIMVAAMNIFKLVIDSQRSAVATQNVEESLKYFLEMTGKEVRMAKRNNGVCSLPASSIYQVTAGTNSDVLSFRNYHDDCVEYYLKPDTSGTMRFYISRNGVGAFITPTKVNISELHFIFRQDTPINQPTVTMELVAYALGKEQDRSEMRIQTTLTSRYYKKD